MTLPPDFRTSSIRLHGTAEFPVAAEGRTVAQRQHLRVSAITRNAPHLRLLHDVGRMASARSSRCATRRAIGKGFAAAHILRLRRRPPHRAFRPRCSSPAVDPPPPARAVRCRHAAQHRARVSGDRRPMLLLRVCAIHFGSFVIQRHELDGTRPARTPASPSSPFLDSLAGATITSISRRRRADNARVRRAHPLQSPARPVTRRRAARPSSAA